MLEWGMQLTGAEIELRGIDASSVAQAQTVLALPKAKEQGGCRRCGSLQLAVLPSGKRYCPACLNLGRLETGMRLYRFPAGSWPRQKAPLTWQGQLTDAQQRASQALLASVKAGRDHLLWAVTGAGKTELLFAAIAWALAAGQRVAIASPRIDVVLELAPRLQQAFAAVPQSVHYGGAPLPKAPGQLVLATTHQLMRFYHAFDLLVIDEVDAFPFSQEKSLQFAAKQAAAGPTVYLSATPNQALRLAASQQKIGVSRLFRRFHQQDLPEPKVALFSHARLPHLLGAPLQKILTAALKDGRQCLLFVPDLDWVGPLTAAVKTLEPAGAGVYAADPKRQEKVLALRQGAIRLLVTTTILERGVTIPHCSVVILAADSARYSAAGLIQMAGRAGRSARSFDDPVWFCARHYTLAMAEAGRTIHQMNQEGKHG